MLITYKVISFLRVLLFTCCSHDTVRAPDSCMSWSLSTAALLSLYRAPINFFEYNACTPIYIPSLCIAGYVTRMWRVIQDLLLQRMTMVYLPRIASKKLCYNCYSNSNKGQYCRQISLVVNVGTFLGSILRCPGRTIPRLVQLLFLVTWTYTMGLKPTVFLLLCI